MVDPETKPDELHEIEYISDNYTNGDSEKPGLKTDKNGIALVPQPSNDPRDPLNWKPSRKLLILFVISLSSFASATQAAANGSGLVAQAMVYHKSLLEMSYSGCLTDMSATNQLSLANSGVAAGPLLWSPIAKCFGKSRVFFWSLILGTVCNVWSAVLTKSDQYNNFVVSRLFACLLGAAPTTVGSMIVMEMFYLHHRGKALGIYIMCTVLGVAVGPTFSGFIVENADWPVQFWYIVGLMAMCAVLCFLFLDETTWNRENPAASHVLELPQGPIGRRVAIYFSFHRLSDTKLLDEAALVSKLFLHPICIAIGLCLLVLFGWLVSINTLLPVFMQKPVFIGGYGFSAIRFASFSFVSWVSILAALIYGFLTMDRLPLWLCKRRGGRWQPEFRLHCLWFPVLLVYPPALGLFGAAMYYHLHYMVVALAVFLIAFSGMSCVPPLVSYAVEAIGPELANEITAVVYFWRMVLRIAIPFFIDPWIESSGADWVYGTMAFLTIFVFGVIGLLMRYGRAIRKRSFLSREQETDAMLVL